MNLSNLTVGCFDLGLWPENCLRLIQDCKAVYYHSPNYSAFPEPFKRYIGSFDGMKISEDFFDDLSKDKYDFVFIPDTKCRGVVNLCRKLGVPTAGVGDCECIETDRWHGRKIQEKNGLPTQEHYQIFGVSDLEKFIKNNAGEWYIKVPNDFRGIEESFKVLDPKDAESTLRHFAYALGPFAEDIEFLVEEFLEGPEPGLDFIARGDQLVLPTMVGYEEKGTGIIERTYWKESEVPKAMKMVFDGFAPEYKKYGLNFFSSFETKMSKEKGKGPGPVPFALDQTHRLAGPGTAAIQCELIENYSEVVAGMAYGKEIDPIIKFKYSAACAMYSEEGMQGFLNLSFPRDLRKWVKMRMGCKKGRDYYSIPKFDSIGTVIGFGSSIDEAVGLVRERMEDVHGKRLDKGIDRLEKIKGSIEEGRKCGINF
jgi:hypothetical protein